VDLCESTAGVEVATRGAASLILEDLLDPDTIERRDRLSAEHPCRDLLDGIAIKWADLDAAPVLALRERADTYESRPE